MEGGKEWKVNLRGIQLCSDDHTQVHLHGRRARDRRQGQGLGCSRRFLRGALERQHQHLLLLLRGCWWPQRPKPEGKGDNYYRLYVLAL